MLSKLSTDVVTFGVVGRICARSKPTIPAPPPPPNTPRPPGLGADPPPPPAPPATPNARVSTYMDENGDCWRVTQWMGIRPTYGAPVSGYITKEPIDCSEL